MMDWTSTWDEAVDLTRKWLSAVSGAQSATMTAAMRNMELMSNSFAQLWGEQAKELLPADSRFKDEAWSENRAFNALKQLYLITANWLMDVADTMEDMDPNLHHRAKFWTKQFVDAMSPTNFALSNPSVIDETIRTGGQNLAQGMRNFVSDLQKRQVSQVPEGSFEVGRDLAVTSGKVVYRNQLMELIQYEPSTERVWSVPILVVPPWINKYYIMDMRPDNSMFKYLIDSGFTLFAISWRNADSSMRNLDWGDYMEQGPLQAMRIIKSITRRQRVHLVGYCLGGLMAETTAAYMAATGDTTAKTATFFAMHQDFTDVGDVSVFISEPEVQFLEWLMSVSGGYLDGRNMAGTFSMLRANDLIWRYVINDYLLGKEPPAFDLLFWNSDSTRVPETVHSFLVRNLFLENKLIEANAIEVNGVGIDLGRITIPVYAVATKRDHIVPWKSAFKIRELVGGPVRFILSDSGHIAGIINHPAKQKRAYWTCESSEKETDPDTWLACANEHRRPGSWWEDWIPWLEKQSGRRVEPPQVGNKKYEPIMDAPGEYVLER